MKNLEESCRGPAAEPEVMRALRLARQEVALYVALADLGGVFDVLAATEALSGAADRFISVAVRFLLREAARLGRLRLSSEADPERGCGLAVLALGKLGARELNYSSDADIVVFFDPECAAIEKAVEPVTLFTRLTQGLVRLLQERTADGYVLRIDLRLRPDPGSTGVAVSLPAAYAYYESLGQNWERAALIKARPVAGDKALGESFLSRLTPFIWRKYFDYAAIADIAAMKRQIHAVRGHEEIAVAGHDVKLGRGGIREIEFFVQTQQLIFGGKRQRLRGARTLEMLEELGREGWITREAVTDLRGAYLFLREIEHRLQMVADEQTQRLPQDPDALERFAKFCGYAEEGRFCSALTLNLQRVSYHYGRLFEHSPRLDAAAGSLVFTGAGDDPETLETLLRMGFKHPSVASETIRGWHFGRRPAVRSARAREVLTDLVPSLLQAFSRSGDPDAALAGAVIEVAFLHTERVFVDAHGRVPDGKAMVLGLGKLGSREMTAASDLDLILIYDFDPSRPESDGGRLLHAAQYYTRLAQRLVSALTVATRRGRLYDVDMRLRPSGRQGPLATQLAHFTAYQQEEAETWEHMALTRARPIAGDERLSGEVKNAIKSILMRKRDARLRREVYDMRQLIAQSKGDGDAWDLKLAAGGLIDIEFLAQYLVLAHAYAQPGLIIPSTSKVIETAAHLSLLDSEQGRILVSAHRLFSDVTQILRLTLEAGSDPREANDAVKRRLARAAAQPSFSALESMLCETRADVRRIFDSL
ncbi:MAG TPA: hypothetical protein VFF88_08905, partial [Methylocella sp.]|nr:hypothetical protein [Methylocella sp.]